MIIDIPTNLILCYINYHFGLRYSSGSGDLRLVEDVCLDDPKSSLGVGEDVDFYEYSGCGGTQLGENQAEKPQGPADRCGPETE